MSEPTIRELEAAVGKQPAPSVAEVLEADVFLDCHCEEAHKRSEFTWIAGWWVHPYEGIEWSGPYDDTPDVIFTTEEPKLTGAWHAPCGSIMAELMSPSEYQEVSPDPNQQTLPIAKPDARRIEDVPLP